MELEAGDTLYFSLIDVEGGMSAAFKFLEVHNELFGLPGIDGEVVTECCQALDLISLG